MVRTQIQIPDPLYREIKRIAREHDWSVAEVIRRGVEAVVRTYPPDKQSKREGWTMPPPIQAALKDSDPGWIKEQIRADSEHHD